MPSRSVVACVCTCCIVLVGACGGGTGESQPERAEETRAQAAADGSLCSFGPAVAADGRRRLALIVGVGRYQNEKVPDLDGPPNDARRVYELVTSEKGYGIPSANTCLLLDEQATTARFKEAFEQGLVARAQPGDVALIFFAGHGSQTKDKNGDEPDQWDETLLFSDARIGAQRDFVDDELNGLLARLHEKTDNIVLILDSCNSGTVTRGDSGLVARFFVPDEGEEPDGSGSGDGAAGWGTEALPGLVAFTAAGDGTPALEVGGQGIFTSALLSVLSQAGNRPLTYAQVARQVPPLVAAKSYQIPYFQGDLQRAVLGGATARRALGWDVVAATGAEVQLSGPPLPGIGVGAELHVFDGAVSGTPSPEAAKATVVITSLTGVNARARIGARPTGAPPVAPGDLAILARPADEYLKIELGLRSAGDGALPAARAAAIRAAIGAHPEARMLVDVAEGGGEFELAVGFDDTLELRGPENAVRNTIRNDAGVPDVLWKHARQRALLQLRGEGGADFVDNETLRARLVPAARQPPCARGEWVQAAANAEQVVPLCHDWNLEVSLAADAPKALAIGALILSTDGSTFGLPRDGRTVLLRPGETTVFSASGETFRGSPPLDTRDQILVFGTQETNPVAWNRLTETSASRGAATERMGTLYRTLDRYLKPGTRGSAPVEEASEPTTWTMTSVGTRVEANSRFLEPTTSTPLAASSREYTLKRFDIRPYLPDDPNTALARVLRTADALATASPTDGYGYQQHDWSRGSDPANLKTGIDCSRAIWYAFTRSGLPYNREDRYLSTSMMVGGQSWMSDQFEQCPIDGDFALGDVLVYRSNDPQRGDGHVVMVVDSQKRIGWGSHGWDGEGRTPGVEPDTGVEYQLIKYKKDWARWDRSDMSLRMCWRYREFAADARTGRGLPGVAALQSPCDQGVCRP